MTPPIVEIVGWVAVAMMLTTCPLVSIGRVSGGSALIQDLKMVGAAGFVLDGVWRAIGIASLSRRAPKR